jgi:hypothetical protein
VIDWTSGDLVLQKARKVSQLNPKATTGDKAAKAAKAAKAWSLDRFWEWEGVGGNGKSLIIGINHFFI